MYERPCEKLIVWKEADALCMLAYDRTKHFPDSERFRLVNQICKSAYSVPMNIVEGNMKRKQNDKVNFMNIAIASLEELHYQFRLSLNLGYISKKEFDDIDQHIHRVSYLLHQFRSSILKKP